MQDATKEAEEAEEKSRRERLEEVISRSRACQVEIPVEVANQSCQTDFNNSNEVCMC